MIYHSLTKYSLLKLLIDMKLVNGADPTIISVLADLKKTTAIRPSTIYRQRIEELGVIYRTTNPDFDTIERVIGKIYNEIYNISKRYEEPLKEEE